MALFLVAVICFFAGAFSQEEMCKNSQDGYIVQVACWGYMQCEGGEVVTKKCDPGTVLERNGLACVKPGSPETMCGEEEVCVGRADGRYADMSVGCQSFFVCEQERFFGRHYCPRTLLYNEPAGVCDWAYNVPQPCGGKVPAVEPTTAAPYNECFMRKEGWTVEIGCWGYKKCIDGQVSETKCPSGTVLERESMECKPPGEGNTACGDPRTSLCEAKLDGNYPDTSKGCQSFFSCKSQKMSNRIYCPSILVFNEGLGVCDWPYNVLEPCGTKVKKEE